MKSFIITIKNNANNQTTIEASGPDNIRVEAQPFSWQPTPALEQTLIQLADEQARVHPTGVQALGTALYDALFSREIAVAFSQAQSKVGEKNLRIRLQIEPPELAALPWEAMRNREVWLALDGGTPLVRMLAEGASGNFETLEINKPLRILFIGASPANLDKLDVDGQYQQLQKQLAEPLTKKDVALTSLFHPTQEQLRRELLKDYHIIYFAGHGAPAKTETSFDGTTKHTPASIYIDDGSKQSSELSVPTPGQAYPLTAETLAAMLKGRRNTRLVFLGACNTSAIKQSSDDYDSVMLSGFAQDLTHQAKLPAMVAMQYFISDKQAIPLTAHFFAAIAEFNPVDVALAEARSAIVRQGQPMGRDVFAPVIYLQAENAALFKKAWNRMAWALAALLAVVLVLAGIGGIFLEGQRAGEEQARYAAQTQEAIALVTSEARETARAAAQTTAEAEATQRVYAQGTAAAESTAKAIEQARADQEERVAMSRELASQSTQKLDNQLDLGLLLALESLKQADTFEARDSLLSALKFSPHLAKILTPHDPNNLETHVKFSPDGKLIGVSNCGEISIEGNGLSCSRWQITLWDVESGQIVKNIDTEYEWNVKPKIVFSPNEKIIASSGKINDSTSVILWDIESGESINSPIIGDYSLAFSPHGEILAMGDMLWNVSQNQLLNDLNLSYVEASTFSPDGSLFALVADNEITIWETNNGIQLKQRLLGHKSVKGLAFTPNGDYLISGGWDGHVVAWNVETGQMLYNPIEQSGQVNSLDISPNGNILVTGGITGTGEGKLDFWNTKNVFNGISRLGEPIVAYKNSQIWDLDFSSDNKTVATGSRNSSVLLWDTTYIGQRIDWFGRQVSPNEAFESFILNSNGKILLISHYYEEENSYRVGLFDTDNWQSIGTPFDTNGRPQALSPDNKKLIISVASGEYDYDIGAIVYKTYSSYLWDIETEQRIATISESENIISGEEHHGWAFSPDGELLASNYCLEPGYNICTKAEIILWDSATLQPIGAPISATTSGQMKFSPDGKLLLMYRINDSYINSITVWDVATREKIHDLPDVPRAGGSHEIAFSPDGKIIATGDYYGRIVMWNIETGKLLPYLSGDVEVGVGVRAVAFNPVDRMVASVDNKGYVYLWDTQTGQQFSQPLGKHVENYPRYDVKFLSNGKHLVSSSYGDGIYIWNTDIESWKARACRVANRNLTLEEWQTYLGDKPYYPTCPDLPLPEGIDMADIATPTPTSNESDSPSSGDTLTPSTPTRPINSSGDVLSRPTPTRPVNSSGDVLPRSTPE